MTELRPSMSKEFRSQILGLGANSLYLWCISQRMHTGHPVCRFESNGFAAETTTVSTVSHVWLSHVEYTDNVDIQHVHNGGEYRVGVCHKIRTIYQLHGCYWHACLCSNFRGRHPTRDSKTCTEILNDMRRKEQYVVRLG